MNHKSLSIVVSSQFTEEENNIFKSKIKKSIGLKDFEILIYNNFDEYSLTEIYNIGLNNSKHDIVVFLHNDIDFNTKNWGRILLNKFNTSKYGILGVAGTTNMNYDGMWWSDRNKMIGGLYHSKNNKKYETKYSNSYGKEIIDVCIVDGVFIAVNKNCLNSCFNENFKGYHFYDISFCIDNYISGTKIGVIFDIKITHYSIGETNDEWEMNRLKFLSLYDKTLPIKIDVKEIRDISTKDLKLKRQPLLSIIVLHKDNNQMLFNMIESLYEKTNYDNFNIYIADTGSILCNINKLKKYIKNYDNINLIKFDSYNFARNNNDVVKNYVDKDTELLMFLNNDIIFINDVISNMVDVYLKNSYNIGTIGCRLYYEDNTIQHSSINIIKSRENYRVSHYGLKSYYKYLKGIHKNVFGNTAACMITPYKTFVQLDMFNEEYIECFEDVEYNLNCLSMNKNNYFVGNAVAYHLESQTRDLNNDKNEKMKIDFNLLQNKFKINSKTVKNYVNKLL